MVRLLGKNREMAAKLLPARDLRVLLEPKRWEILGALAEEPSTVRELSESLGMGEQLVYYHVNQLKKSGVVSVVRTEERRGALTRWYGVKDASFAVILREVWTEKRELPPLLKDFFSDGSLDADIIVGSPDPHGPHAARARDGFMVADLCLYLGSLSSGVAPSVRTDTQVRENELKGKNLVIVGGTVTNMLTEKVNPGLAVQMKLTDRWGIYSKKTKKTYYEDTGLIVKAKNPWDLSKSMLVIAGRSFMGTRAAILAIVQKAELLSGANVVEGFDRDGDGIVDSVEIRE